jgi:transcription initiation factor TFIIB
VQRKELSKSQKLDMQYPFHSSRICTNCSSYQTAITDPESGEIICSNCGMIISDKIEDTIHPERRMHTFEDVDKRARIGAPSSLARHDMGLSTTIGRSDNDANGQKIVSSTRSTFERLRTWDSRIQVNSSTDRNLSKAFSQLHLLKDKLGLSDAIVEKTAYIYRKAEEKKLAKGRSIIAILASALYIACRDTETSRTIKDIALASNIKPKDIARNYRVLIRELDISVPIADPLKYTAKIANTAKLSEITKRHAFDTMNEVIKKEIPAGKHPASLAATVLYLACKKSGERISQDNLAHAAGITGVTIRARLKELTRSFELN